jgi:ribosomal protein S18 acetylase RimI-like enzyme
MTEVRVRPAGVDDADGIGRVQVRSWQVAYRGLMPDDVLDALDPAARAQWWRQCVASQGFGQTVLVAVDTAARTVVGFVSAGDAHGPATEPDNAGEVYAIYVEPQGWGIGTGWALLDAAVTYLAATGRRPVRLWSLDGNERACRFYERYGFVADGATGTHPVGAGPDLRTVRYTLDRG